MPPTSMVLGIRGILWRLRASVSYDIVENSKSMNDSPLLCLPQNVLSSYGKVHVLRPWQSKMYQGKRLLQGL